MTDDQVGKLTVGDRISRGASTGTVHTIGPEFIGIKWDETDWSEIYTRAEMVQFNLGGEL